MDAPHLKKILAFLLALKNLERNPSENEKKWWENIAAKLQLQLKLRSNSWEGIEEDLFRSLEADPSLKQLYQSYLEEINNIEYNSIIECIPEWSELEKQFFEDNGDRLIPCGSFPVDQQPDLKTDEITNVTIFVLTNKDPIAATKNVNFIEKIQQIINLPKQRGRSN